MENIELEKRAMNLAVRAKDLKVVDQGSLTRASELLLAGKEIERAIKSFFAPLKAKAHAAWKELCDAENKELGKLAPVIAVLNRAVAGYKAEQEKKRVEAEEAARKAEKEREKLQNETLDKIQEMIGVEAEAAGRGDIKAVKMAQAEADKILAQAADEEKKIVPASIVPEIPKTDGLSLRVYWKAKVVDFHALIQAVLSEQVSIEALSPNLPYLNDLAGKLKDQVKIPGIEIYSESKMAMIGKNTRG